MAKKIVIVGSAHPLRGGGITTFNERLARELMSVGYDVTIYSFSLQYPNFLFPGKSQFTDEPAPKDLKIVTKINSVNPLNWLSVGRELRKLRPDYVIVRYWIPFIGASLGSILRNIKKNKHTKVVAIIDNIIPHEKRPGDTFLSKYFVGPVDEYLVMSKRVGEDLKAFVKKDKPIRYVPHPLYDNYGDILSKQDARGKLGLKQGEKYILFFGFIRKYKGLDILYKAMSHPRILEKNIRLIVAGEYYVNKSEYETLAQELGIHHALELYTDFIPNEEVKYYFSAADLVVQPYRTATQSGISQLAYHFEKPMLVTQVGGLPEIVNHGEAGYVVPVDSEAVANAILDFYDNNREPNFIIKVKENKKRFSWENLVKGLIK